jgi:dienelactone hydrolase
MIKCLFRFPVLVLFVFTTTALYSQTDYNVNYMVNEEPYEGYFVPARDNSKLVLLVHNWDGLTDYEKKRAHSLSELGYRVFGVGVRPTEVKDRRQHTGELYENREKNASIIIWRT